MNAADVLLPKEVVQTIVQTCLCWQRCTSLLPVLGCYRQQMKNEADALMSPLTFCARAGGGDPARKSSPSEELGPEVVVANARPAHQRQPAAPALVGRTADTVL